MSMNDRKRSLADNLKAMIVIRMRVMYVWLKWKYLSKLLIFKSAEIIWTKLKLEDSELIEIKKRVGDGSQSKIFHGCSY